ncbi:MAG: DUF354 domain-containing protein [Actinobacteria bacterium]|nr:DUF354 domain-containing protein [Actinomycetota bacterium]
MPRSSSSGPRLWVDMTNSPHVLVLRPIIAEFRRRGWEVSVTAREFAQTVPLLERFGIEHTLIGRHRGKHTLMKAWGMAARSAAMLKFGAGRGFHLALSHASNDLPVASRLLGIPHVTMFDYEFARLSHSINVRLSTKSLIPDAIPVEALLQYGGRPEKVDRYPGLKEEYYLADFEPDPQVIDELGLDPSKIMVVLRTPPSMAAYHRMENTLFDEFLRMLANRDDLQGVVLLRTPEQRAGVEAIGAKNLIIPEKVVDAQSLIYYADLVVSGGGTLNREAAALGTPAYTVFSGVMGAVDKDLIAQGRLSLPKQASEIKLEKKGQTHTRSFRDVGELVDRIAAVAKEI